MWFLDRMTCQLSTSYSSAAPINRASSLTKSCPERDIRIPPFILRPVRREAALPMIVFTRSEIVSQQLSAEGEDASARRHSRNFGRPAFVLQAAIVEEESYPGLREGTQGKTEGRVMPSSSLRHQRRPRRRWPKYQVSPVVTASMMEPYIRGARDDVSQPRDTPARRWA
jgi:hypothetical protein